MQADKRRVNSATLNGTKDRNNNNKGLLGIAEAETPNSSSIFLLPFLLFGLSLGGGGRKLHFPHHSVGKEVAKKLKYDANTEVSICGKLSFSHPQPIFFYFQEAFLTGNLKATIVYKTPN